MTGIISASLTLFSIQVGFPVAGILVGDYFLKSQKDKKIRYALGISAFAFGGWLLSNHITTKYLEDVEITLEAEGEDVVLDWFDTNLVRRTSYDVKDNDARIIRFDYALPSDTYKDGGFVSTYPQQQSRPIVYEPMMREGLEEIEYDLDEAFRMSDGYYFISRNVPNTNRSEKSELIFFTMSGDGRKRPLQIFQLAHRHY